MDIIVKDIVYREDGIDLFVQLPEELVGEKIPLEIMRREVSSHSVVYHKLMTAFSVDTKFEINHSDFEQFPYYHSEEVWDIRIQTNTTQLILQNGGDVSKTHYIKKNWKEFQWKPYWTKANYLAFFMKSVQTKASFIMRDIYLLDNYLYVKAEIPTLEEEDTYYILLENESFKETDRINQMCYFRIPVDRFEFDHTGKFTSPFMLAVCRNDVKVLLTSEAPAVCYEQKDEMFTIRLKMEKEHSTLELDLKKKGVSIIGSCVSRDNFNRSFNEDYKRDYEVMGLQNQTSIISLVSKPITYDVNDISNIGEWESKQLIGELNKSFFDYQKFGENNLVILDFFSDVYFGVIKIDDAYLTNNHWKLHKTDLYKRWSAYPTYTIEKDFAAYFELWKKSIHELFNRISITSPHAKIVLHKARFTDKYRKEDGSIAFFENAKKVAMYNDAWATFDEYVEANFNVIPMMVGEEKLISIEDHKWGKFNVHFDFPYYHEFIKKLRELV